MKRLLLLSVCLMLAAGPAFAQGGSIGLFSDPGASDCNYYDTVPGIYPVYVFHVATLGSTASQFMVSWDAGMLASKVGESYNFALSIGSFEVGISISYQDCLTGTFQLGLINFFTQGLSTPCASVWVEPDPIAIPPGEIWTVDCGQPDGNLVVAIGGIMMVNPTQECECTTPVEDTSWGQIKALYKE